MQNVGKSSCNINLTKEEVRQKPNETNPFFGFQIVVPFPVSYLILSYPTGQLKLDMLLRA